MNLFVGDSVQNFSIDSLKFGDIIIAKRPNCAIEGHIYGPYIVIKVLGDIVYLIYGTSKHHGNDLQYFCINGKDYNLNDKVGYFDLKIKKLNRSNIRIYASSLTEKDKNYLKRKLYVRNQSYKDLDKLEEIESYPISCGDIIRTKINKYIVIDELDDEYECLKLQYTKDNKYIKIDKNNYDIIYDRVVSIPKSDQYLRKDTIDPKNLKLILNKLKEEIKNNYSDKEIDRGALVKDSLFYYYIYNNENGIINTFRVYHDSYIDFENLIKINNTMYRTDFELFEFNENDSNLVFVSKASEIEIETIKKQKKSYKKSKKEKKIEVKLINEDIKAGAIVYNKTLAKERYIVYKRQGKYAYAIDYIEYLKGNIVTNVLDVRNLVYCDKVTDQRIESILKQVEEGISSKKKR